MPPKRTLFVPGVKGHEARGCRRTPVEGDRPRERVGHAGATTLLQAIGTALDSEPPARNAGDRLDGALKRYLAALAREPALARTFLVEVYAAGPAALARRVEVQRRFTEALTIQLKGKSEKQRFACEAVVAAASALVTQRVCAGRAEDMRELHGPLLRFARSSLEAAGVALATR